MSAVLEVEQLTKSFGNNKVLKNITFDVEKGEFLSILGPSGCGKTTLLRILTGLLPADGGRIIKNKIDITNVHPSKRGMGVVFQNYALFQNMTVWDNVKYALKVNKDTRSKAEELATEALSKVRLEDCLHKKPSDLSGGQQQRVAIARTLALKPEIILFDEPMSALDAGTRLELRKELKRLQYESDITMIYITHDQEEAFALSEHIMVMSKGNIEQFDTPKRIVSNPANDYVKEFVVNNIQIKIDSLLRHMG